MHSNTQQHLTLSLSRTKRIDVGGTFTDLLLVNVRTSAISAKAKVPSTPHDPSEGVLNGIKVRLFFSSLCFPRLWLCCFVVFTQMPSPSTPPSSLPILSPAHQAFTTPPSPSRPPSLSLTPENLRPRQHRHGPSRAHPPRDHCCYQRCPRGERGEGGAHHHGGASSDSAH